MPERSFIERLTDAVTQLRDPLPFKVLGDIETKSKEVARPDFGRSGFDTYGWSRSKIDYKGEIGEYSNSSLIMAVVNWTGINIAEALPVVTKPNDKSEDEIERGHPAADLIRRPNPFYIWADYCLAGAFSWWMGDWYMTKVRNNKGLLIELWYLPNHLVEPRWPGDHKSPEVPLSEVEGDPREAFISHYEYRQPGKPPTLIKKSDMVHIKRGINKRNPRKGECVWESVLEELYGHNAVNRFSATILGNMGMVQHLLSPKEKGDVISETDAARIKAQWIQNSTGENANKPMVAPGAMEATRLSFNPHELDLKELDKAPQAAIAGVTGIPAILLQFIIGLEHGHYGAAYGEARKHGYENVIIPIMNHISEDLTWQVLPELDNTKGARLTFDLTDVRVLQDNRDSLYRRESEALRAGAKTLNMVLTSLGKETVNGGDVFYVPSTSTPMTIERIRAIADGTVAPPIPAPIDPASLAKIVDVDRAIAYLEAQINEFEVPR